MRYQRQSRYGGEDDKCQSLERVRGSDGEAGLHVQGPDDALKNEGRNGSTKQQEPLG